MAAASQADSSSARREDGRICQARMYGLRRRLHVCQANAALTRWKSSYTMSGSSDSGGAVGDSIVPGAALHTLDAAAICGSDGTSTSTCFFKRLCYSLLAPLVLWGPLRPMACRGDPACPRRADAADGEQCVTDLAVNQFAAALCRGYVDAAGVMQPHQHAGITAGPRGSWAVRRHPAQREAQIEHSRPPPLP